MSNVGYDLDSSGGLMPLIRALIKPPDEDVNAHKNKKPQHPYYKRPGKGHNHDSCDACGEGGDLICCDRCPASFHLGCYDPPLDENDIPAGLWLCKECRGADEAEKPASSRGSRATSPLDPKPEDKKTRLLRNKQKSKDDVKEEEEAAKEPQKELTPMEVLVKAARIMNPRQFELPREMQVPCLFPGTDKGEEGVKNGNVSVVTTDSYGCVPIPAKLCYACQGTCKMAPLLQCDYCPLLFHQDCLDPPLTALPTGRWMCPNHVEQYIDWKLVNSISATQRVALWEQFSGPVDQHAIKVDFIRRARKARPAFRMKVPVGMRGRVVVPGMVRYHYENPPALLPSRREYVRCRDVLKTLQASGYSEDLDDSEEKQTICMNSSCPAYRAQGECPHGRSHLRGASESDAKKDLRDIGEARLRRPSESSDLSDSDFEYLTAATKRRKSHSDASPGKRRRAAARLELAADAGAAELLAAVDEQLDKLDERLVKLLAWQRLQQVLVGEQCGGPWRRVPLSRAAAALVARSVDRARLARCGVRHVALPSELLSRGERERIARSVWGAPRALSPPPAPPAGHALGDACVRATLCAIEQPARNGLGDGLGRPVPMRLSRLSIGTDSGCDVVLDASCCSRVSPRHAVIFCDEVTRHFELINYSEWGTRVNNVLYACDVSMTGVEGSKEAEGAAGAAGAGGVPRQPEPAEGDEADATAAALRDMIHGNRAPRSGACRCPRAAPRAAWEGSALVPHAALLHFGCLMYVFSVADPPAFPYVALPAEPAL